MELSAYLAVSLDGFIARADGSMDWLRGAGPRPVAEAERYRGFIQRVAAVVMGRSMARSRRHHGLPGRASTERVRRAAV